MFTLRVEISFDAGHRLMAYPGKCAAPHGHTYKVEIFVIGQHLNDLDLLADFGDIKKPLKDWIDTNWDHGFLVNSNDRALIEALRVVPECKIYLFRESNPSAEILARELFEVAGRLLALRVERVRVWESPTQYADFNSDQETACAIVGNTVSA